MNNRWFVAPATHTKGAKKMALATLPQADQIACFLHHYARDAASPFQFFLVISKHSMNLAVSFVA
jgi:hypothetical protein